MTLKKIFQQNKNRWQIGGAAVGAVLGLGLWLLTVQTYFDFKQLLRGGEGATVVSLNKPVSLLNTLGGKSIFRPNEIEDLKNQSFTEGLAAFTAARFKVSASSQMIQFYTEFFLEAVPDAWVDGGGSRFRWSEGQREIPIVLPREYLTLYNFGFAASQGLPQFTPSTIGAFAFDVTLRSPSGKVGLFNGRIVGFSDKINSILVPQNFMDWANREYGDGSPSAVTRLLLVLKNGQESNFERFIEEKNYELSGSRLSRYAPLLYSVLSALAVVAVLMVVLAVLVFLLNYQLIVSRSAADIRLLLQLGYRPAQIEDILRGAVGRLLIGVLVAVILLLAIIRFALIKHFDSQGFSLDKNYHILIFIIGIFAIAMIAILNFWNIKKSVLAQAK
jgi:hypothetical protein